MTVATRAAADGGARPVRFIGEGGERGVRCASCLPAG